MSGRVLPFLLALLLCLGIAEGCRAQSPEEPGSEIRVVHYELDLNVDLERLSVEGSAELSVLRTHAAHLALTLTGPRVSEVSVNGTATPFSHQTDVLSLALPEGSADTLQVRVVYAGAPGTGLYAGSVRGRRLVYTDGWPTRTSGWLPGLHHPSQPATIEMRIRAESGTIAASGTVVEQEIGSVRAVLDHPSPTYAFAFAIADFDTSSTGPYRHYHFGDDRGLRRTEDIVAAAVGIIGEYPYSSLATVAVPFGFAGMENASIAFLNADLYGTPGDLEGVLIHEIVHQWFGNAVNIATWRDLWISEGITTYLTAVVEGRLDGEEAGRDALIDMARLDPLLARRSPAIVPGRISDPMEMLNWVVYRKAGSMLHALRLKVGDAAFFDTLRSLYADRTLRGLGTSDFIRAFEVSSGTDLRAFFDFWLSGTRFPRLVLEWNPSTQVLSWEITQDEGSLEDVDFEMEIAIEDEVWYVNRSEGSAMLPGITGRPSVRPVGIMLDISWK